VTTHALNNQAANGRGQAAAGWSVASNVFLIVIKLTAFILTASVSVLAEAINSSADLIGSTVALLSVRAASAPPDEQHAYGHGKFENLSGVLIALVVLIGAAYAIVEAVHHLHDLTPISQPLPAIVVMAVSFLVNVAVSRNLLRIGKATESPALIADGRHRISDVWSSLGVFASLILLKVTHLPWIDPLVALAVSGVILWVGYEIARDALLTLSDIALPDSEEQMLRDVLESDPRVLGYHALRTRKSGPHRYADVHVQIADTHTFVGAHALSEELEDKMRETLPNLHPIIHIEPYEAEMAHQEEAHSDEPARRTKER
jgi:cation diffusion facilitator family transporter